MGLLLAIFYLGFTFLSWILLLRDQWAITVLVNFYPSLRPFFSNARLFLLHLGLNTITSIIFALLALTSFAVYFLALRKPPQPSKVVLFSLAFFLIVFFSYPVLSTDVFDYILSDRVAVVLHRNVWTTPPSAVISANNPFYSLASWQTLVNPYGPVNQFFYSLAGGLSNNDILTSLLAHKLLVLVFTLGSLIVAIKILKKHFSDNLSRGLILLFWNPLFVLETVGSAHNDILMIFFLFLSLYFWLGKKYFWAGILLATAVQVKFIPIILFPFLLAYLVKEKISSLARFLTGFTIVTTLSLLYLGQALAPFLNRLAIGSSIYWQSLPQLIHPLFAQEKLFFLAGFFGLFFWQAYRVFLRKKSPLVAFVTTMFFYLLFFTSVYWNWYVVWVLALLPFLPWSRLVRAVTVFSLTSLLAYPLYWLSLRFGHQNPLWPVIIYLFLAAVPLGDYLYGKDRSKIQG